MVPKVFSRDEQRLLRPRGPLIRHEPVAAGQDGRNLRFPGATACATPKTDFEYFAGCANLYRNNFRYPGRIHVPGTDPVLARSPPCNCGF